MVYGKTALTGVLGWKDAPKPISIVLDAGRAKLTKVLGVSTQSNDSKDVLKQVQSLNPQELKKLKNILCTN